MVVRTNIFAINAHRNALSVSNARDRASRNLSSGFRINSAADDAAGLAISEGMRSQIRGLRQNHRNAQDGVSLLQVMEAGMSSIADMIQRMRELVVQAANDTNVLLNREQIQLEIDQLIEEIEHMSQRVELNTLLTGNYERDDDANELAAPFAAAMMMSEDAIMQLYGA